MNIHVEYVREQFNYFIFKAQILFYYYDFF